MIQVDEKETIRRLHFIKRHSIRRIARELNHSRKTVRKAVEDGSPPQYRLSKPRASPVMGPYLEKIEEWLEEDKQRPSKQRHTAHRIYVRMKGELGFTGAERTVRLHVSAFKKRLSEMAIPLEFDPGADAQCDWGEAQVRLAGEITKVNYLCLTLSYSGRAFVMAFPTQRQEAFFEGQRRAFEWFEGVPARISYDNLTTAVQRVLRGHNRIEQQSFIAFRSHYLFESHFATPVHPQEQGRVESKVGYARRNFFVPLPEAASFEDLNGMLLERLREEDQRLVAGKSLTIGAAWEAEKPQLRALPRFPYRCCVSRPVQANRLSLVTFDGHRYSVPVEYGFRRLTLHAFVWQVEIACGDHVIATHRRRYGNEVDTLEIEHYLPLLMRRPGAFPYAKPVRQWQMPEVYREFYAELIRLHSSDGVREFLHVLSLGRQYGGEALERAIGQALSENRADGERVRQILAGTTLAAMNPLAPAEQPRVILPDLGQFDRLREPVAAGAVI